MKFHVPRPVIVMPRHFWPGLVGPGFRHGLPDGSRYPCGVSVKVLARATNNPVEVDCRRCVRSELLQRFLRSGLSGVVLSTAELEREGLIPGGSDAT